MVQLSHPYMTTGKPSGLTRWTFVGKVLSLFFNILFRFVTAFLRRSKHLLISWLQSPSAVILESRKIKSVTVSLFSPSFCNEVIGPEAMILVFSMLSFKPAFSLSSFLPIKSLFRLHLMTLILQNKETFPDGSESSETEGEGEIQSVKGAIHLCCLWRWKKEI